MKKQTENCSKCQQPLASQASKDGLYYWCFLVKNPKRNPKNYEIRLSSIISDIDEVLIEFRKQTPNLRVLGYTSIPEKYHKDQRDIFILIDGQLRINPEMLPL